MKPSPVPVLGFVAFSGTGKTTLLKQLVRLLKKRGLHIAVIKHSHHDIEMDTPGKDSYELRHAGAEQTVLASAGRTILTIEHAQTHADPPLQRALEALDSNSLDLVLVEGFKHANFAKIELHRQSLGKPYLYPHDAAIIALASDVAPVTEKQPPLWLDINQPQQIADYVISHFSLAASS